MEVARRQFQVARHHPYRTARNFYGGYKLARSIYEAAEPEITQYFKKRKRSLRSNGPPKKKLKVQESKAKPKEMARKRNGGRSGMSTSGRRNPRFTKSTKPKRRTKKKKKLVLVTKTQVKKWNKASVNAKVDLSTYHHYIRTVKQTLCAANSSVFDAEDGMLVSKLEGLIDLIKVVNSVQPATAKANIINTTLSQKVRVEMGTNARWINNFGIPVWVDVYCLVPKKDTSITPEVAFTGGLTDVDAPSATSVFTYPSWSNDFNHLWKMKSHKKTCLAPGESMSLGFKKKFNYDPSIPDVQLETFQKAFGSHVYACRVEGTLGHDAADLTKPASSIAGVDWHIDAHVKVIYDAGGMKLITYDVQNLAEAPAGLVVVGWPTNAENTTFDAAPPS